VSSVYKSEIRTAHSDIYLRLFVIKKHQDVCSRSDENDAR